MTIYRDLCGCVWDLQGDVWICVNRCRKHSKAKKKRPFRPKAECVRAGGRYD